MAFTLPQNQFSSEIESVEKKVNDFREKAKVLVDQYVFRPDAASGIGSIKLDVIGEQTLTMSSDITDNFVESNIAYQDHISIKPMQYTIQGEVGELVYYAKPALEEVTGFVSQTLGSVGAFLPSMSRTMAQVSNAVTKTANFLDRIDSYFNVLENLSFSDTAQERAYTALMILWMVREPLTITTPWSSFFNFCITNVKLTQPRETKDKTIISITLKQLRLADLTTKPFNAKKYQGRSGAQKAPVVEQGQTQGLPSSALNNVADDFGKAFTGDKKAIASGNKKVAVKGGKK